MENSTDFNVQSFNTAAPKTKKTGLRFVLFIIILLVLGAGAYFFKMKLEMAKIEETKSQTYSGLEFDTVSKAKLYDPAQEETDFQLRPNETLPENGITYIVNKEQKLVQSDIFNKAQKDGWVFASGTKEIEGGIVYKFFDGQKYHFVKLSGGLEPDENGAFETTVNIVTLN